MSLTKRQKSRAVWGFFCCFKTLSVRNRHGPALPEQAGREREGAALVYCCCPPAGPARDAPASAVLPTSGFAVAATAWFCATKLLLNRCDCMSRSAHPG